AAVIKNYEFDRLRYRVSGNTYRAADLTHWLALDVAAQALTDTGFADGIGQGGIVAVKVVPPYIFAVVLLPVVAFDGFVIADGGHPDVNFRAGIIVDGRFDLFADELAQMGSG
ncbi:hypothetical protein DC030_15000, partial [Enterococcus faecalis]